MALLTEELGEVLTIVGFALQLLGKAGRFGIDTPGVLDPMTGLLDLGVTPRSRLASELGDLMAATDYACERGLVSREDVQAQRVKKIMKLLDPESKDNVGKRLAP